MSYDVDQFLVDLRGLGVHVRKSEAFAECSRFGADWQAGFIALSHQGRAKGAFLVATSSSALPGVKAAAARFGFTSDQCESLLANIHLSWPSSDAHADIDALIFTLDQIRANHGGETPVVVEGLLGRKKRPLVGISFAERSKPRGKTPLVVLTG
jgi:hypothetical protein